MDKKQTAVEWFMEKIGEKQPNGLYVIDTLEDVQNVFQQAKEMEKEKLKDSWVEGSIHWGTNKTFEQYYEETYGGNK
jgi:hypothetical protein